MSQHNDLGRWGEQVAADHLRSMGWYIKARNWHSGHVDLDIVAIDADMTMLLFVEVKTRATAAWGLPEEAVTRTKMMNIMQAAAHFLTLQNLWHLDIRYDVIAVTGTPDTSFTLQHHEDVADISDTQLYREESRRQLWKQKNTLHWY